MSTWCEIGNENGILVGKPTNNLKERVACFWRCSGADGTLLADPTDATGQHARMCNCIPFFDHVHHVRISISNGASVCIMSVQSHCVMSPVTCLPDVHVLEVE